MSTEPLSGQAGAGKPDDAIQHQAEAPSHQSKPPAEALSGKQRDGTPGTQATDKAEAPTASRDVPEPDSLGG